MKKGQSTLPDFMKIGASPIKDKEIGMDGREMANRFISAMDTAFEKWVPKPNYTLEVV